MVNKDLWNLFAGQKIGHSEINMNGKRQQSFQKL